MDKLKEVPGAGKLLGRVILGIFLVVALGVGLTMLGLAIGDVAGPFRYLVGVMIGVLIAWFGVGYFRYMGHPPPPDVEPVHVDPRLRLSYVCEMCGLELAVVAVAKERAPKHCGESMVLVRRTD